MFGYISERPVDGNAPRYPLQIIEIDEDIICLKKDTTTIIDDRDPARDSESLQLFELFNTGKPRNKGD